LYRKDAAGSLSRLYADHTPENSINGTDINLVYQLSEKETIWVAVRDFLDDEASDSEYSIKISESRSDYKNNSASGAIFLPLDNQAGCHLDRIDSIGDIDNYRVDITATNVYSFQSIFNAKKDTDVKLKMQLFNELMQLVNADWVPAEGIYSINSYLTPGTYYITIEDFGRDHFDLSSPYNICANTEYNVEAGLNDNQASAVSHLFTNNQLTLSGELAYGNDADWYQFPTPQSNNTVSVMSVSLSENISDTDIFYEVFDKNNNIAFSFIQTSGSGSTEKQIRLSDENYTIKVSTPNGEDVNSSPEYQIDIQLTEINDNAELGLSDNSITLARSVILPDSGLIEGKISYLADQDWYRIDVPLKTNTYQRLEIFASSDDYSPVEYQVQLIEDVVIKTLTDPIATDNILDLHTSLLIEPGNSQDTRRFYLKVSDQFATKSSAEARYFIQIKVDDIEQTLSGSTPNGVNDNQVVFHDEISEQQNLSSQNTDSKITIEHNGLIKKDYFADSSLTLFRDPNNAHNKVIRTVNIDGTTTIKLPWIAGYIDYAEDQDWFKFDLKNLGISNAGTTSYPDTKWYYDLAIEFITQSGSATEMQWRLYRDQGQNKYIRDRKTTKGDGFFASNGDDNLEASSTRLMTSETATDQPFWVGSDWAETFYLSVFDYNYVKQPADGKTNPRQDIDWSNQQTPYYIQVTLTYHPGVERP